MNNKKIPLHFRLAILLAASFLISGCATDLSQKSDLLKLSHNDEGFVDFADQETETIYDPLSLLKRGEAFRVKEDYPAAVAEYSRFLELYPSHRMAAFAQYALGECYESQVSTTDRDPTPVEQAIFAFRQVAEKYPDSLYAKEAAEKVSTLKSHQTESQFRIGYFYYKKAAYPAAIARFENLLKEAAPGASAEKTLYYLSIALDRSGNREQAKVVLQRLQSEYKDSSFLQKNPF
jgi:outer membrane protein assembly factor BamD